MNDMLDFEQGRAIWGRVRPAQSAGAATVEPLELAAWLDGTLDESTQARIDAALIADPHLLAKALAIRAARDTPEHDAQRLAVRARTLFDPTPQTMRGGGLLGRLFAPRGLQWAAVAGAMLFAAIGGFNIGDLMAEDISTVNAQQSTFVYGVPLAPDPFADDDEA